jgi:hypothetical protein
MKRATICKNTKDDSLSGGDEITVRTNMRTVEKELLVG